MKGVTQYNSLESQGRKLGGQARRVLDNFLDMWDHTDEENLDYEEATTRGNQRRVKIFLQEKGNL